MGYRVGIFLKNEQLRAEGLPVKSAVGALSEERREQLNPASSSTRAKTSGDGSSRSVRLGQAQRRAVPLTNRP
jgi:hypothetical protein